MIFAIALTLRFFFSFIFCSENKLGVHKSKNLLNPNELKEAYGQDDDDDEDEDGSEYSFDIESFEKDGLPLRKKDQISDKQLEKLLEEEYNEEEIGELEEVKVVFVS